MTPSLISVIVPARNAARYLEASLQSILDQNRKHLLEIIVVDDASSDGTRELAETFFHDHDAAGIEMRCISQPPAGAAAARNRGVKESRGNWLAFLDADDLWVAEKTAWQCAAAELQPEYDAILGAAQNFISPELSAAEKSQRPCPPGPQAAPLIQTMLIRRESYFLVGEMNPGLPVGEFIDWYSRALDLGLRFLMLPETVLLRRWHDQNQGVQKRGEYAAAYRQILRQHLGRRKGRASPPPGVLRSPGQAPQVPPCDGIP